MFRNPKLLEKTNFARFNLETPLSFPGNRQRQKKTAYRFVVNDRNRWFGFYNAYSRVNYTLEVVASGNGIAADTTSSTLINKLEAKSARKYLYNIDEAHKAVFIKNLLDFSDDYGRSTAKSQFWYLDTAESVVLDDNAGIKSRELLTRSGQNNVPKTNETIIPLKIWFINEVDNVN